MTGSPPPSQPVPPPSPAPAPPPPPKNRRIAIFRWKAIGPLLLVLGVVLVLVILFAEPVARTTTEEAGTEMLGTQVDLGSLDLHPRETTVDLRSLQIADPFNVNRNLIEADAIRLQLNPEALAEKKLVIEQFAMRGLRFGTARERPARPVSGDGFAPRTLRAVRGWAERFDVPLLSLTPIDTIRQLVMDPTQLATIQQAQALVARTDSTRKALEQGFTTLDPRPTIDSARALADRLSRTTPRELGLTGAKEALESGRRTLRALDSLKGRLENFERQVRGGVDALGTGVQALDSARRQDYAFAKSLLKLPSVDAPEIGKAVFGRVSIDRFQQALYWAELARHYMPPGLLPTETQGPKRLRASGTTVRFPKEHEYPAFLLKQGEVDFAIGGDSPLRGAYAAVVRGLTSTPALYGRPMTLSASRRGSGADANVGALDVDAVIDHVGEQVRDSVNARLRGVSLPRFDLPGLPFGVVPGTGTTQLAFSRRGNQLRGRWAVAANQVEWSADSARGQLSDLEGLVWRVVSGLRNLEVAAEVGGTIAAPKLAVRTNLDEAIAARLRAVLGDEVAKAERLVRAKVDSLVADKVEPIKRQVAQVQADAIQRVAAERQRIEDARRQLEAELKRLAGPAGDLIPLPRLRP